MYEWPGASLSLTASKGDSTCKLKHARVDARYADIQTHIHPYCTHVSVAVSTHVSSELPMLSLRHLPAPLFPRTKAWGKTGSAHYGQGKRRKDREKIATLLVRAEEDSSDSSPCFGDAQEHAADG